MVLAPTDLVKTVVQDLETVFTCKYKGPLAEYVGRTITITWDANLMGHVKFMRPVLVQKLAEEYPPTVGPLPKLPVTLRHMHVKEDWD